MKDGEKEREREKEKDLHLMLMALILPNDSGLFSLTQFEITKNLQFTSVTGVS